MDATLAALIAFTLAVSAVSGRNYLPPVFGFLTQHGKTIAVSAIFLAFLGFLLHAPLQ